MRPKSRTLTEHELEIMKVVWEQGRCSVRDVYETLRERKGVAYTTVMTMMNILETKGHLRKWADGRAYLYEAVQEKAATEATLVDDFVNRVFDGAAQALVLTLVREGKLGAEELEALSRLAAEVPEEEP